MSRAYFEPTPLVEGQRMVNYLKQVAREFTAWANEGVDAAPPTAPRPAPVVPVPDMAAANAIRDESRAFRYDSHVRGERHNSIDATRVISNLRRAGMVIVKLEDIK